MFRSTSGLPLRLTAHWSSLPLVPGELRFRSLRQRAGLWSGLTLRAGCSRRHDCARLSRESSSTCAKATHGSSLEQPAALIYCPGRSLLHLPTWADRRRCFERVAASLLPNGRFAWNAFAFDHHIASAIEQHADANPGVPVPHTNHYSVSDNRVDITLDDGGTGSLWWATKNEWLGLLDVAGLHLEALYGGFDGEPLDDDSREYVVVARR